jgi:YVTN family beta-propeller protein
MAIREASNRWKLFVKVVIVFLTVVNRVAVEAEVKEGIKEEIDKKGAERRTSLRAAQTMVVAYVTNWSSGTVSVINITTNQVTATISVEGGEPNAVAITPDGSQAYVTNSESDTVSVIDTATNQVTANIIVGSRPEAVAIAVVQIGGRSTTSKTSGTTTSAATTGSTSGTTTTIVAYVANYGSGTVSVIDTATNQVTATISVGIGPDGVAITPDGSQAYVVNNYDSTVSVIDTATNQVTATISVGIVPYGVAITPDGTQAYVTNAGNDTVSVIDTATNQVTATISVGSVPNAVAIAVVQIGGRSTTSKTSGTTSAETTHGFISGGSRNEISVIVMIVAFLPYWMC